MRQQLDIFDAARARGERDVAMERVNANADADWKRFVTALVVEIAKKYSEFTTDDVERLRIARGGPSTPEGRAYGPIMLEAARRGVCRKTGRVRNSELVSNHGRPKQIWESLIR